MLYTNGKTDITPREAGYDPSRIDALHRHFERLMAEKKIQCAAYCLSRNGKVFSSGGMGPVRYNDPETPMRSDTPFEIASITKAFTTVTVMKLVENGLLRLDTPVRDILPEFNLRDFCEITIYHLLTHTSGMLPDEGSLLMENNDYWKTVEAYISRYNPETDGSFNWIRAALQAGIRRKLGEEWQYCSFGYAILGEIITRLSGMNVHQYMEDEIFTPLGMSDTTFYPTPALARRALVKDSDAEKELHDIIADTAPTDPTEKYYRLIPLTSGGLYSTAADLVKFGDMCLNMGRSGDIRILGRKIFERITTRTIFGIPNYGWGVNDPDRAYGIGLDMKSNAEYIYSPGSFFHEGAGGCTLIMDPQEGLTAAYMLPFHKFSSEALYNTQIIIWSGLI